MKTKLPLAPKHLSRECKRLWVAVLNDWQVEDFAGLAILQVGLEARDRAAKCRKQIDREGEVLTDRFGQKKPHPLLAAERDSRSAFLTAIKSLNME